VFSSPVEAATALFAAVKSDDTAALGSILGPDSQQLLSSGDAVADKNSLAQFASEWDQTHRLAYDDQARVIIYPWAPTTGPDRFRLSKRIMVGSSTPQPGRMS
jgi:hypothetical protein